MEGKFKVDYIHSNEQMQVYKLLKRGFDIVSSLAAIILLSPIFLMIAIAIRIDSPGKIAFSHKRKGLNGKEIFVYKFRSMYENSQEIFESFSDELKNEYYKNFKLDNDPRITKVGDFLRKTSLDELPQLFNILKGEMSVVGPRPIVEKELIKFEGLERKLLSVKPGLTGFWQANGRSNTTYEERVEMEMYYIDNRSMKLDIKIIIDTIISVVKRDGAI